SSGNSKEQRRCWLESVAVSEALVKDQPDVLDYAANLGITYYNFGVLASVEQKLDEKFAWMQKAIKTLQPWRARSRDEKVRWFLMSAYQGRGEVQAERKSLQGALSDYQKALALALPAEKPGLKLETATARARAGQHKEATDEAEGILREERPSEEHLETAAVVIALATGAVLKDEKLPDDERRRLKDHYAGRAVELLKQARSRGGYTTAEAVAALEKDPDLAALKNRKDFQDFVEEQKSAIKKRKP